MTSYRVPFNRPGLAGNELRYIQESVDSGRISGDGVFTEKCRRLLEELLGARRVLLTTSCTTALELAALLLDLGPGRRGDHAVVHLRLHGERGRAPRRAPGLRRHPPGHAQPRRAPPAVAGHAAHAGDPPRALRRRRLRDGRDPGRSRAGHGLEVIEDNAHGLFGSYRGRPLGSLGGLAAQSFHETKNISCGEGGALVINDERYVERAEILREKGTNRSRMFRGLVDKYTWVDVGSSALPSDILAAFLYAQLESRAAIQASRRRIWECYARELPGWAGARGIGLPSVPAHCEQPYHLFYLVTASLEQRTRLIAHLKQRGILAVFHYLPLHLSEMGQRLGGKPGDCPVTEDLSDRVLRLPLYKDLSEEEQAYVVDSLRAFDG